MCGIIGINSNKPVSATIINSLKKLEYRGYDSAGIATLSKGSINEIKSEGRVNNLEKNPLVSNMEGTIGIGHVRWATHGLPNTINAHPHSSQNVSVVHNGIIENSTLLKKFLVNKGHKFKSQKDTEVIVHLITYLNDGEFCIIKKNYVEFFNEEGVKINKKVLELSSNEEKYDKGDYKHFMAKEIEEQPISLKNGIKE